MKAMKIVRRVALAVVLLLIIGVVVVVFSLDHIVKSAVESQATQQLNLKTTLSGASLSLTGGSLKLNDLEIASPPGFSAPQMMSLGQSTVTVSYGQLRNDPVHVADITLDKPKLVIENVNGELNFKKAADGMPKGEPAPAQGSSKPPLKLIIDNLTVKDAVVVVRPAIPGLPPEINVPVGTFTMKNVGSGDGNNNGAAVKDVVMQVVSALAAHASSSDKLPPPLPALLKGNVADVLNQLGGEAQKRVLAALPGGLGDTIAKGLADPKALLNGVPGLSGAPGAGPTSLPSLPGVPSLPGKIDPGKAADGLGGLLGGKKKDK